MDGMDTIFSVLVFGRNRLLIGLSNAMVIFFLSDINSFIFLPLNPGIYRTSDVPNILCPRCKKQDESHPPSYLLLQAVQNYSRRHQ